MDYYSLDEILEEEEMVDTRFTVGGHKLGYLDAKRKRPSDDIEMDEEVEVPMWLAITIAQKGYVDLIGCKLFTASVKNTLLAGPAKASFASAPYYYEVALRVVPLLEDTVRDGDLQAGPDSVLLGLYRERYKEILTKCHNWRQEDITSFCMSLTMSERRVFAAGYRTICDFEQWRNQEGGHIHKCGFLKSRKRKQPVP